MKTLKIYLPILVLNLILISCQKFVDVKKNSSTALITTAGDCQLLLDNYSGMNTGYPGDGEVSADNYYLSDVALLLPALNQTDRDMYNWAASAIRQGADQWQNPYKTVYTANLVLETVDQLKGGSTDPAVLDNLRGSALFFRAFCFWQIAQLYAKPYHAATADQDPGIPIRLNSDVSLVVGRGTVAQTYSRIIQDLQEAVSLMPTISSMPTPPSRPNKAAAYAMLTRVYLSMGDYQNALTNANAALKINSQLIDFNTLNTSTPVPFNPRFNKEVIFHSLMAPSPALNPNNNTARIDPALYASYQDNDLRKVIFFKQNNTSVQVSDPTPEDPNHTSPVVVPDGTYSFSGNYEPSIQSNFFNGLAVDELYLTRAECYARAGNTDAAMSDLNTLLASRYNSSFVPLTAANADVALSVTLTERRKELLMRGLRWTDARRLNLSLSRKTLSINGQSTGTVSGGYTVTFTYPVVATNHLPAGDPRFTLLIPQGVIDNSSISQNPR